MQKEHISINLSKEDIRKIQAGFPHTLKDCEDNEITINPPSVTCPRCNISPSHTSNTEEQIKWEEDHIREHKICSACIQELNENNNPPVLHQMGICPHCKSEEIDYGSFELDDTGGYYEITCQSCSHTSREYYKLVYQETKGDTP